MASSHDQEIFPSDAPSITVNQYGPQFHGENRADGASSIRQGNENQNTANITLNISGREKSDILQQIQYARGACYDSPEQKRDPKCIKGTREQLLKDIRSWVEDPRGSTGFWLRGLAGTGKSTVARTVAAELSADGFLVASFFFRRGEEDRGSPQLFVRTILRQLAEYPSLQDPLIDAFRKSGTREKDLETEWCSLIQAPLSRQQDRNIIVLVLDAIDESKNPQSSRYEMFDFLAKKKHFNIPNLRLFVTARPQEEDESKELHQVFLLHMIPKSVVEEDIKKFFEVEFNSYNEKNDRNAGFPTKHQIKKLVERCSPLFIAAKTSFDFITEGKVGLESRLKQLLDQTEGLDDQEVLDNMYLIVIKEAIPAVSSSKRKRTKILHQDFEGFQKCLGGIITLRESLNYRDLASLLSAEVADVRRVLKAFHAVLLLPENDDTPIHVFHESFPDFVTNRERVEVTCEEHNEKAGLCHTQGHTVDARNLYIDMEASHSRIFNRCLEIMQVLRENICDLAGPGIRAANIPTETLQKKFPRTLRYACKHWARHFISSHHLESDCAHLLEFLSCHLLHWIEAMSCLDFLNDVIRQLDDLKRTLNQISSLGRRVDGESLGMEDVAAFEDLHKFVADSRHFVTFNKDAMRDGPLQVYSSALLFSPEGSAVKQRYKDILSSWATCGAKMDQNWSAVQLDLRKQTQPHNIRDFRFSLNGERIASLDEGPSLIVWDALTGSMLWETSGIMCMDVFTGCDGQWVLAGGHGSGGITLWVEMESRRRRSLAVDGLDEVAIMAMKSSSDGMRLGAITAKEEVIVWDLETMGCGERLPRNGLPDGLRLCTINSPGISNTLDAERFLAASGYIENKACVAVWRQRYNEGWTVFHTYTAQSRFTIDFIVVKEYLVSLCGFPLALMVWKISEKQLVLCRDIPGDITTTPLIERVFQPNDAHILQQYEYDVNRLHNQAQSPSLRESEHVTNVALSADCKVVAGIFSAGPLLGELGLWNSGTGQRLAISSNAQLDPYGPLRLSPDGRTVAGRLLDHSIRLINCALLCQQTPLEECLARERVDTDPPQENSPIVSPDGRFVATFEDPKKTREWVKIWDTEAHEETKAEAMKSTGEAQQILRSEPFSSSSSFYKTPASRFLFSPKSDRLVLVSWFIDDTLTQLDFWTCSQEGKWTYEIRPSGVGAILLERIPHESQFASFSEDSKLFSIALKEAYTRTSIAVVKLDSVEPLVYDPSLPHFDTSLDDDILMELSCYGSCQFMAARRGQRSYHPGTAVTQHSIDFWTYGFRDQPTIYKSIVCESSMPVTVALNHSQNTLAILDGPSMVRLYEVSGSFSQVRNTYRLGTPHDPNSTGFITTCSKGSCIISCQDGAITFPDEQSPFGSCSCGLALVSRINNGPWLHWHGKPFLFIPPAWRNMEISIRGQTVLCYDKYRQELFWMRLGEALRASLQRQPVQQNCPRCDQGYGSDSE